ncbi:hypothetical protein AWZ03_014717 [Drosophila navojoa]|uniref:MiT/TFE transcription factors N-terminal domain-containing protein n=1 Tax=Drosophila navojoa TaxID=7232 RepID=A0A484ATB6_DRONA|nr:hypothetical protein AWZ03_014717 [Drosophila navojoa]
MSPSDESQQQQPLICDIEVGVEPRNSMEHDEINAISSCIQKRLNEKSTTNIRVSVGIDKDLEMILEMDPSIVDLGDITVKEPTDTRVFGLPPLTGGPTFKTAVPTSRTQLKLQLQREQQQQEQQQILMQQQQQQHMLHTQDQTILNGFGLSTAGFQYDANNGCNRSSACGSGSLNQHQQQKQQQLHQNQHSITQPGQKDRLLVSSPVALKVPLQSIGVDVPPQVLQVSTVLENPTRYHVIQKQKNQVRQYLSESLKPSIWECQNFKLQHFRRKYDESFAISVSSYVAKPKFCGNKCIRDPHRPPKIKKLRQIL